MKVLVSYDDSQGAKEALKYALSMKCAINEYKIVYVIPTIVGISASFDSYIPESVYEGQDKTADEILSHASKELDKAGVKYELIKLNSNGEEISKLIIEEAEKDNVDLIITGTRKLHGISKLILGSVSSGIIAHSNIPVTVVPP
ncbi:MULTISPECIES: universal stress protein [Acidiplasma]|jgi:nucleotide-binding universal stress UspA family protein|uniref:Universal stress protein n=2 Tax=Acidiplasma TaxID=507753 RepID=A0A0Q0RPU7_9ARCH|nr:MULTISPECIES: universal stress protein [Acidiplasma]KJE48534.1 universal stress protein [Acidiplasma sp. MBA-1]KPV46326.1 universal stress protein [Acidiplasma aeolicum]KQB34177.1 universal stress protein [Acidiplasma cupricumulans]KQB34616.1 universal stress protein [Acidiplasma aeolicum]WMT55608.1 MAG: universal stress protein [Acidiplasma sp.]